MQYFYRKLNNKESCPLTERPEPIAHCNENDILVHHVVRLLVRRVAELKCTPVNVKNNRQQFSLILQRYLLQGRVDVEIQAVLGTDHTILRVFVNVQVLKAFRGRFRRRKFTNPCAYRLRRLETENIFWK